jgi:hypothetical protein
MAIWNSSRVRNCLHCSADISLRPPQAFVCGQSCNHKYHRKKAAELRDQTTKECGYCTKPFVDDSPAKNGVYCSEVCKKKARTVRHGGIPRARLEPRTRPIVDGQRQCVKCDQWKPIEDFPKKKAAKFGVTQTCKRCVADSSAINMKKRRIENPRYKNDPIYNLNMRIRCSISRAIRKNGRSKKIEKMFNYTIDELKIHIEKQFTKGMSWDKYLNGEIHIDHIIPVSSFDFTTFDQWNACYGLPNLRPLWARDNLIKHAKILTLL